MRPAVGSGAIQFGVTERQIAVLRDHFRKAARRSSAGRDTVSVKGELGLLCTTVVYHLRLDPVPTDEVERRVQQWRQQSPGRLRIGEEEFMAWFAKEFVVAQDHLARSRYDGDPVWERESRPPDAAVDP